MDFLVCFNILVNLTKCILTYKNFLNDEYFLSSKLWLKFVLGTCFDLMLSYLCESPSYLKIHKELSVNPLAPVGSFMTHKKCQNRRDGYWKSKTFYCLFDVVMLPTVDCM